MAQAPTNKNPGRPGADKPNQPVPAPEGVQNPHGSRGDSGKRGGGPGSKRQ